MNVPVMKDLIQEVEGEILIPEIRVWCHPHYDGKDGEDYYEVFDNFGDALNFISNNKVAEPAPLIAYDGYEINIFDMESYDIEESNVEVQEKLTPSERMYAHSACCNAHWELMFFNDNMYILLPPLGQNELRPSHC